jgi:hypothetical protein
VLNPFSNRRIAEPRRRNPRYYARTPAPRKASAYPCGNPYGARLVGAEQTGVAAATLLEHYGKFIHTLDADRAELSKIEGEGGTDCPTVM